MYETERRLNTSTETERPSHKTIVHTTEGNQLKISSVYFTLNDDDDNIGQCMIPHADYFYSRIYTAMRQPTVRPCLCVYKQHTKFTRKPIQIKAHIGAASYNRPRTYSCASETRFRWVYRAFSVFTRFSAVSLHMCASFDVFLVFVFSSVQELYWWCCLSCAVVCVAVLAFPTSFVLCKSCNVPVSVELVFVLVEWMFFSARNYALFGYEIPEHTDKVSLHNGLDVFFSCTMR